MDQLLIRDLDDGLIRKLRARAAALGVSVEEEARRILRESLADDPPKMDFFDFLRTMPDPGDDSIFERQSGAPSRERIEAIIETLEIENNPEAMKAIGAYEKGKAKFKDVECLGDD